MIDRYTRPEMAHIFSLENKYAVWQEIEVLACEPRPNSASAASPKRMLPGFVSTPGSIGRGRRYRGGHPS